MMNKLAATLLPLALTTACSLSSDSTDDSLLGDCGSSACGDDTGGDHDDGGGDGGGGGCSSCGDDGAGGGGSVDVGADVDVHASLDVALVGSGVYLGVFPLGCLDVSGDFSAHANATATLDGDNWVIATVDANASIDIGNGCSCSGIDINAMASITVNASIDANVTSCHQACSNQGSSCEQACNQSGNTIVATAALDANAAASVSVGGDLDLDALVGVAVNLDLTAVVDVNGNVVVDL